MSKEFLWIRMILNSQNARKGRDRSWNFGFGYLSLADLGCPKVFLHTSFVYSILLWF